VGVHDQSVNIGGVSADARIKSGYDERCVGGNSNEVEQEREHHEADDRDDFGVVVVPGDVPRAAMIAAVDDSAADDSAVDNPPVNNFWIEDPGTDDRGVDDIGRLSNGRHG
jgi:hypothetical protein